LAVADNKKEAPVGATETNSMEVVLIAMVNAEVNGKESLEEEELSDEGS
jgi:hypothetical protein